MTNTERIQANNTELQSILDIAYALPDIENIDDELSEQDAIISQIQEEIAQKAAPSYNTCTVAITTTGSQIARSVLYTTVENNVVENHFVSGQSLSNTLTINNCLCNSVLWLWEPTDIVVCESDMSLLQYSSSGPMQSEALVFNTPSTAGAVGTLNILTD